jgi:hypothetical protein
MSRPPQHIVVPAPMTYYRLWFGRLMAPRKRGAICSHVQEAEAV